MTLTTVYVGEMDMKRLLIVDDERIERNGVKMLLKGMGHEFEILEASNGKQACQILAENDIDMMLTDIKMPFMSGLDLVKCARELKGHFPIAIFSGFGEFTYAQEAIKYGVTDYILKPVKPQEFKQTISRMLEACRLKEVQEEEKWNNTNYLYKYFLRKYLFTGKQSYIEKLSQEGVKLSNTQNRIEHIQNMMLLDTNDNFFEEYGVELIEQIENLISRKIEYLDLNTNQILLIFFQNTNDNYSRIAHKIYDFILEHYHVKCYIAVSQKITSISDFPKVYQDLENLIVNKFYYSDENIFLYDPEPEYNQIEHLKIDYQKQIQDCIDRKDIPQLWENFGKLKTQIHRGTIDSQLYVKFIFCQIVKDIYDQVQKEGSSQMIEAVESIYQAGNLDAICKIAENCIRDFEQNCLQAKTNVRNDVDLIKQYIANHMDEDLSIDKLASIVFLSQGYLSYIFKRETGMTISRYIKKCRMEKAQELLKNSNLKIAEICEKLSFSNVSYFCQSFREYCGISPEKYRKGEIENAQMDE